MAKQLSEILVEQGHLDELQLKQALIYAKQNEVQLSEAVVRLGYLTEEKVTMALSKHFSIPYASKENGILVPERDQNLQEIIPEKFARENFIVPLFIEDDALAVALLDPTNVFLLENLKMMSGKQIRPFIASKSQLLGVMDTFYSNKNFLEEVMTATVEKTSSTPATSEEDVEIDTSGVLDLDKALLHMHKMYYNHNIL